MQENHCGRKYKVLIMGGKMKSLSLQTGLAVLILFTWAFAANPAYAEKGKKQGPKEMSEKHNGKGEASQKRAYETGSSGGERTRYFSPEHRAYIQDYYANQVRRGKCPPGLAKKGNGCMPPGQAKKWAIGQRLPRDVIFYDLPPSVLVQLGPAPSRHRFVRVAQDILLIAVGTGMVIDAIEDLSWEFGH
jgi:hypothetical protein